MGCHLVAEVPGQRLSQVSWQCRDRCTEGVGDGVAWWLPAGSATSIRYRVERSTRGLGVGGLVALWTNPHPQATDANGYTTLGLFLWIPGLIVIAVLLMVEQRARSRSS
jgi:hypothetical protein